MTYVAGWCHIKVQYDNYPEVMQRYIESAITYYKHSTRLCQPFSCNTSDLMRVEVKDVSKSIG